MEQNGALVNNLFTMIGPKLKRRAGELGISDAEVARRIGMSPRRYGHYTTDEREPDLATLAQICRALETTPNALLNFQAHAGSEIKIAGTQFIPVAVYDARAHMGPGGEGSEQVVDHLAFGQEWLRGVTRASADRLAVIEIDGDSMEPTLRSGDHALIDQSDATPKARDGIYALRTDTGLQVKRVSAHPVTGMLTIRSDNPAYETYRDIDPGAVKILGRVIWTGRRV